MDFLEVVNFSGFLMVFYWVVESFPEVLQVFGMCFL